MGKGNGCLEAHQFVGLPLKYLSLLNIHWDTLLFCSKLWYFISSRESSNAQTDQQQSPDNAKA